MVGEESLMFGEVGGSDPQLLRVHVMNVSS